MKNIFRLTAVALLAATLFSACTGAFEDMNTNPKGVSDEELKQDNNYIGMHFIPMMQSIYYNKKCRCQCMGISAYSKFECRFVVRLYQYGYCICRQCK